MMHATKSEKKERKKGRQGKQLKKKRDIERKQERARKQNENNIYLKSEESFSVGKVEKVDKDKDKVDAFLLKKYWIQFKNGIEQIRFHLAILKRRKFPMRNSHKREIGGGCFMIPLFAKQFIVMCDGLHANADYKSYNSKYKNWMKYKKHKNRAANIYEIHCNPETQYECKAALYYRGILNFDSCFKADLASGLFQQQETYVHYNNRKTIETIRNRYGHLCDNEGLNDFCRYDCCCEVAHQLNYTLRCPNEFAYTIQRYWRRYLNREKRTQLYYSIISEFLKQYGIGLDGFLWSYLKKFIK